MTSTAVSPHGVALSVVQGDRHQLWWEFALNASYRWEAHCHGIEDDRWQPRLHWLAAELGLEPLMDRVVESLTPSERVRADVARALLTRPQVIRWEAPFMHLSPVEEARVRTLLDRLKRIEGLTVLLVSRDISQAEVQAR